MEILGLKVRHKIFGGGVVTEVDGNNLTVKFESKISKFVYPDAFEKFIEALDSFVQENIIKELNNKREIRQKKLSSLVDNKKVALNEKNTYSSTKKTKSIESGFKKDYNVQYLKRHPILDYKQVEEQFGIRISGFGRGINKTETTVVLISSIERKRGGFVYHDHWNNDGEYIYSGEGKTGNQKMTSGNSAIVNAYDEGKEIHLFVKFSPKEYYYQGIFKLVDYAYDDENDELGNLRKEYKFRLKKVD